MTKKISPKAALTMGASQKLDRWLGENLGLWIGGARDSFVLPFSREVPFVMDIEKHLFAQWWFLEIRRRENHWEARFQYASVRRDDSKIWQYAKTLPLAICRAAIATLIEYQEEKPAE